MFPSERQVTAAVSAGDQIYFLTLPASKKHKTLYGSKAYRPLGCDNRRKTGFHICVKTDRKPGRSIAAGAFRALYSVRMR